MPHDYDDDDTTGFGLGTHIDEADSVNASGGGYSIPSTPFVIAPYRSLAVFVKPSGSIAATVSVTWDYDGLAGGADVTETKVGTLLEGETFIFRNHGVQVTDVTIVADNGTAYVVSPSNVDPLPPSATSASLPWAIVSIAADDPGLAIGATNVAVPYDLTDGSDTFYMTNDATVFSFDSANNAHEVLVNGYYMIQTWTRCRLLGVANAGNFAKRVSTSSLELTLAASMTSFLGGNWTVPGYIATNTFWDPNSIEYADYRGTNPKWQHIRSNSVGAALVGQRSAFQIVRLGDSKDTGTIP